MEISLRYHNDTYAPGIATYGVSGKDGEQGAPGMSMFFSEYSLPGEFSAFAKKITSRMLPVKTEQIVLDRKYINGDLFVTPIGEVYLLLDINKISLSTLNNDSLNAREITAVIKKIALFDQAQGPFNKNTTASELFKGSKLTLSESSSVKTGTGLLNLVKNNNSNISTVNFINMQALYSSAADINLDIKYDNRYNGFVLSSKYPIVIDADLYVKNTGATLTRTSDYSPVLTLNDQSSITDFVTTCKAISYTISAKIYSYNKNNSNAILYGVIYSITLDGTDNNLDTFYGSDTIMIHYQNNSILDFLLYRKTEATYYFKQEYDMTNVNALKNKVENEEANNIRISLIDNFEVYLTCTNNLAEKDGNNTSKYIHINGDIEPTYKYICVVEDTLILMNNGETKSVQDITYNDTLRVYNTLNNKFTSAKPMWIMQPQKVDNYVKITFDDNTTLLVSRGSDGHCHRLYCPSSAKYIQADLLLNKDVFTMLGNKTVVSVEDINESTTIYNIITDKYLTFIANNIITGSGFINNLSLSNDRPYYEFETAGISREMYEGLDLKHTDNTVYNVAKYIKKLETLKK